MVLKWVATCLSLSAFAIASAITIDDFTQGQYSVTLQSGSDYKATAAANVPGGVRTTFFDVLSNPEDEFVTLAIVPGLSVSSTGSRARTTTIVAYGFDEFGSLTDLNLDFGSLSAFEFKFLSNVQPLAMTVRVFSNSGSDQSEFSVSVPGGRNGIAFTQSAPFSQFSGSASFTDIDQIIVELINEPDGTYGIGSFGVVPEPTTIVGVGLALVGLSRSRRHRQ
ncbi:MAG: hypothetical protein HONBIEJF_00853 [Fimbriimonadaceae bacterium]|nr:hypothetical protein [Fimbriimonadaceae bacterium]